MKIKLKGKENKGDIVKLVCENRGVELGKLQEFLQPTSSDIENPLVYDNMALGCLTILKAIQEGKKIGVLVDSDVDGFCSSAMVVNYLVEVHNHKNLVTFMHQDKVHGLTQEIMAKILESGVELMIIPDASSEDFEEHKELKDKGIDVVVIDHHEVERYSDDAVVINNQLSSNGNKTLCGAGMVLKVIEYLDVLTGKNTSTDYYDLASVGLVGDIMLMTHPETRYYVQQGLRNIRNPLLYQLYSATADINFEMISFNIAPTINAFIRVGTYEEKCDVFASMIGDKSIRQIDVRGLGTVDLNLAEYISRIGSRIKSRQTNMVKSALENENTVIYTDNLPITICILDKAANRNLTGLIGNRLAEQHNKPAIVLKEVEENMLRGSGRSIDTFEVFKDYINNIPHFEYAKGHQGAFGVGIEKDNLMKFISDYQGKDLGEDAEVTYVDWSYKEDASAFDIMALDSLKNEWGRGFEKPKFYIDMQKTSNLRIQIIGAKRDTIKFTKNNISYIKFKCSPEEVKLIEECCQSTVSRVEIVGSFSVNEWMDNCYPQVIIDKFEITKSEKSQQPVPDVGFGFGSNVNFFQNVRW